MEDSGASTGTVFYYGNYGKEHTISLRANSGTSLEMGTCTELSTTCSYVGGTPLSSGAWHHWAIARRNGTMSFYFDGKPVSSAYDVSTFATAYGLRLGSGDNSSATYVPGYYFKGHIDEVRVTVGVARYTATFTPPTEAFPNQ